ncbi:MAG: pyruvate dehydrogenase (acetyl-transferring) E1 component subunit alpha [Haloferacaceae archaeon]
MSALGRDPDDRVRVLDETGAVVGDVPDLSDEELVAMYREMRLARRFDERAVSLQRQGRMGTYAPAAGQEAAQAGSVHALDGRDWLFPSYREHVASYVHGVPLAATLRYWMGDERGNARTSGARVFPVAVPVATQIPHAVGLAWAARYRGDDVVSMVHFGDGATSEGDFHEGLNFAGVFDTPTVFVCNNNQWAISTPTDQQTAAETFAAKAAAYGFEGVRVDGMDPLAVYRVVRAAVEKARDPGEGERRPTLVEAVQYRFGAHTTADDPSVYRDEAEVERWKRRDPIPRLERFLRDTGRLDDDRVDAVEREVEATVAEAVEAAEETRRAPATDVFDYVYAEPTPAIREQRAAFERLHERYGDEAFTE